MQVSGFGALTGRDMARAATHPARRMPNPPSATRPCSRAIRSQINDGPVTTYKAGQSFSGLPGDRHGVSANVSETQSTESPVAKTVSDLQFEDQRRVVGNAGKALLVRIADRSGAVDKAR